MLDFGDLLLLQMKNAAMMTAREYKSWTKLQKTIPPITQSTEVKDINIKELATPLNTEQLDDVRANIRVDYENGIQNNLVSDKLAYEENVGVNMPSISEMMAHDQILKGRPQSLNQFFNPRLTNTVETYSQVVTQDAQDYLLKFRPELSPETEKAVENSITHRETQVRLVAEQVKQEVTDDLKDGTLHLNENHELVNDKLGGISALQAQREGKLGQPNGGIRGITGSSKYLPSGKELPASAAGQGECCVYNYFGGGGCGLCNRGASMSGLRMTWRVLA